MMKARRLLAVATASLAVLTFGLAANATTIYVAGADNSNYVSGGPKTCGIGQYWTNGTATALNSSSSFACAFSITATTTTSGTNVYATGFTEASTTAKTKAAYWLNGSLTNLTNGTYGARGESIAVSGSDVYIAGYENSLTSALKKKSKVKSLAVFSNQTRDPITGESRAMFWKDGTSITLPIVSTTRPSAAEGVTVNAGGTEVYISGFDSNSRGYTYPVLWVYTVSGGTMSSEIPLTSTSLTHNVVTTSGIQVVTSGTVDTVYVSGYIEPTSTTATAAYWTYSGGTITPTTLTSTGNAYANGIAVSGSNVYVVGYDTNATTDVFYAAKWVNGTEGTLALQGSDAKAYANGIALDSSGNAYVCGYELTAGTSYYKAVYWPSLTSSSTTLTPATSGSSFSAYAYGIFVQ